MTQRRRADLEQEILETIFEVYFDTGIPPTYREVSTRVNTAHSNVWAAVKNLREGGFLRETQGASARSLVLSVAGMERVTGQGAQSATLDASGAVSPRSASVSTTNHIYTPFNYTPSAKPSTGARQAGQGGHGSSAKTNIDY